MGTWISDPITILVDSTDMSSGDMVTRFCFSPDTLGIKKDGLFSVSRKLSFETTQDKASVSVVVSLESAGSYDILMNDIQLFFDPYANIVTIEKCEVDGGGLLFGLFKGSLESELKKTYSAKFTEALKNAHRDNPTMISSPVLTETSLSFLDPEVNKDQTFTRQQ